MTLKPKHRAVGNPLPKRNRRHVMLKRIAARIPDQGALDLVLAQQPTDDVRQAWLVELKPYLAFTPREV
jgi:hypothetical protein